MYQTHIINNPIPRLIIYVYIYIFNWYGPSILLSLMSCMIGLPNLITVWLVGCCEEYETPVFVATQLDFRKWLQEAKE